MADLTRVFIVSQPEVRRRRDYAIHAFCWKVPQYGAAVSHQNFVAHISPFSLAIHSVTVSVTVRPFLSTFLI